MNHFPEKTAIKRSKPSAPLMELLDPDIYIKGKILDYGGGQGQDFKFLYEQKKDVHYWDPNFAHSYLLSYKTVTHQFTPQKTDLSQPFSLICPFRDNTFDTILCTYVLNVLPPDERRETIKNVLSLLKPNGQAFFTVRGPKDKITGKPYKDGVITRRNTFQRLFSLTDLLLEIPDSKPVLNEGNFVTVSVKKAK